MLQAFDVAYFMASTDDLETATAFAAANDADFPVLSDPGGEVARRYGVLRPPGYAARWTFYIDTEGKVAYVDREVSALTAGRDIAARLGELGVARRATATSTGAD